MTPVQWQHCVQLGRGTAGTAVAEVKGYALRVHIVVGLY